MVKAQTDHKFFFGPPGINNKYFRENIENKIAFNVCCGGKDDNLEKADDNSETTVDISGR